MNVVLADCHRPISPTDGTINRRAQLMRGQAGFSAYGKHMEICLTRNLSGMSHENITGGGVSHA